MGRCEARRSFGPSEVAPSGLCGPLNLTKCLAVALKALPKCFRKGRSGSLRRTGCKRPRGSSKKGHGAEVEQETIRIGDFVDRGIRGLQQQLKARLESHIRTDERWLRQPRNRSRNRGFLGFSPGLQPGLGEDG